MYWLHILNVHMNVFIFISWLSFSMCWLELIKKYKQSNAACYDKCNPFTCTVHSCACNLGCVCFVGRCRSFLFCFASFSLLRERRRLLLFRNEKIPLDKMALQKEWTKMETVGRGRGREGTQDIYRPKINKDNTRRQSI